MGFAEDEVKKFIRKNYPMFHDIRLTQLLDYLPCLTQADREKIKCNTKNDGNVLSVSEFFEHLCCRKGWVTELIAALEENNSSDLADVIREVYQTAQRSSQSTQAARSPPAVAQSYQRPVSLPRGSSAPMSDESPPYQPRPTGDPLPTPSPPASLQDVVDYRSPVQETKLPSRNSEMALEVEAGDVKWKTATPDPHNRNAAGSEASLAARHENPISPQAAPPKSPVRHQTPLGEVSEKKVQSSAPVSSTSDASNLGRHWDSFQARPVCVKNGYFGNASRSFGSGTSPAPELAASSTPTASGNLPEENSYLSSDSSLLTPRGGDGAQAEEQRRPPLWGYWQMDVLDNPVNQPFFRLQDVNEQNDAQGQQDSTSNVHATPLLPEVDFRERTDDAILTGHIPADLQRRENLQTAAALGQSPSKNIQLPQRSPRKEPFGPVPGTGPVDGFCSVPSDFSGPSSTDVIPPSSPAAVSPAPSDLYSEDLKPPVQERDLPETDLCSTSEKIMGDSSPRAPVVQPSCVTNIPANSRASRNNPSGSSRSTQIFLSNPEEEEEDISLLKPGTLVSGDIPGGLLDRQLSKPDGEYSGTSDLLRLSCEPSVGSDPLMLSDSTRGSRSDVSERNTSSGAESVSLGHQNDSHSDGGSIKTHVVRVEEPPSVDLSAAPEIARPALGNGGQPPGDCSDFVAGDPPTKNASSPSVRNDGQRNSCQNKSVSGAASWHRSDSTLLAVGLTLTSLVAFVLYKHLKK